MTKTTKKPRLPAGEDTPLYRPPSEAYSLLVRATYGCPHNRCTFCGMYKGYGFRIRQVDEIIAELDQARQDEAVEGAWRDRGHQGAELLDLGQQLRGAGGRHGADERVDEVFELAECFCPVVVCIDDVDLLIASAGSLLRQNANYKEFLATF